MPRKFDPSILFERWKPDPKLVAFKTQKATLDAVQAGKKALMRTGFPLAYIAEGGDEFVELLQAAFDRGLAVTLCHHPSQNDRAEPDVYVLPLEQTWRISALAALRSVAHVDGPWTLAAEAQESLLLGYTTAQRTAWLAAAKQRMAAYGCLTMYTLVTEEQRMAAVSLGKRCFGSASDLVGRTFFFHRDNEMLKKRSIRLLPKGLTLARVGFAWSAVEMLFGSRKTLGRRAFVTASVTKKSAQRIAESFRSNVQFLSVAGWS